MNISFVSMRAESFSRRFLCREWMSEVSEPELKFCLLLNFSAIFPLLFASLSLYVSFMFLSSCCNFLCVWAEFWKSCWKAMTAWLLFNSLYSQCFFFLLSFVCCYRLTKFTNTFCSNWTEQNEITAEKWKQFEHNTGIEAVKGVTLLISILYFGWEGIFFIFSLTHFGYITAERRP